MPLVLYHLIAIIVCSTLFFILKHYPKKAGPVEWAIGDYFNHLSKKIHNAKTGAELEEIKPLVDGFYRKAYQHNPAIILRRSLLHSLRISFTRKLKDIKDGSTVC